MTMAMQSLTKIVQDFQQHGLPTVPEDAKRASMSKGDAELINGVFEQMKAIFPAWQRAFPLPKAEAAAKKEWTKALIESGITTEQQIKFGLQQARGQNLPFFPSPGQFISWCKPTPEMFGLPSVEMALMDVARHRSTHPAVVLAARSTKWERQTLSAEEYKAVFERAYEQLVRRVMAGEDLNCEVMKALPTKDQIKHSPEFYHEAGQRGLEKLRAAMRRHG